MFNRPKAAAVEVEAEEVAKAAGLGKEAAAAEDPGVEEAVEVAEVAGLAEGAVAAEAPFAAALEAEAGKVAEVLALGEAADAEVAAQVAAESSASTASSGSVVAAAGGVAEGAVAGSPAAGVNTGALALSPEVLGCVADGGTKERAAQSAAPSAVGRQPRWEARSWKPSRSRCTARAWARACWARRAAPERRRRGRAAASIPSRGAEG